MIMSVKVVSRKNNLRTGAEVYHYHLRNPGEFLLLHELFFPT